MCAWAVLWSVNYADMVGPLRLRMVFCAGRHVDVVTTHQSRLSGLELYFTPLARTIRCRVRNLRWRSRAESIEMTGPIPKQCHTHPLPLKVAPDIVRMAPDNPEAVRGTCSFCGETVTGRHAIIHYETADREPGVWAECPSCGEIVDPIDAQ